MTRGILSVIASLAIVVGLTGLTATPASADTPSVLVSANGQNYSTTYPGQLFGPSAALVPGGSVDRPFWVKNIQSDDGYLRVTLVNVSASQIDYAQALSLTVSSADQPGTPVPILSAAPCYTLAEGQVIAGGDTLKLDALAQLGNLNGSIGQKAVVNYAIIVELSEEPIAVSDTTCPTTGLPISGDGDYTAPTTSVAPSLYRYNPESHRYTQGTVRGTGSFTTGGTGTPIVTVPTTPPSAGSGETLFQLDVNTARLYQEWDVALWVLGALLGGIMSAIIAVRRRRLLTTPNTRTNGAFR